MIPRLRPGRRLLALAGALALAGCGAPEDDGPAPSPALWEVTGADGARGWLFGTIHAFDEDVDWHTATFERAIAASGLLVVEAGDIGADATGPTPWQILATTPGQPPLTQRVPRENVADLQAALDKAGLDEADFADVETWAAALTLANALREEDGESVDAALLRDAPGDAVFSLEGVSRQLAIFDGLPPADQADLLAAVADSAVTDEGAEQRLTRLWRSGDIEAIAAETHRGLLADPELRKALLVDRNRDWAAQVEGLLRSRARPFVAVGTAHLAGPDGLPALLAARGFTVRRIQ